MSFEIIIDELNKIMNETIKDVKSGTSPFNIKAVVKQTGLNPATIRAWERRYGFPQPQRSEGGHRQYSQRDIDTLNWLKARQDEGLTIRHAIELWQAFVERGEDPLESDGAANNESTAPVSPTLMGSQIDQLRQSWISACLAFDRRAAEQVMGQAFALFNPETVAVQLLQQGLAEVGQGWYTGQVTVQQEHFASALSGQRLEMLIAAAPPPTRPERIIVATAPGDYHTFSPLLLTFLLRQRGWEVIYLGANVPVAEMESTIEQLRPQLIIVSAQLLQTAATLRDLGQIVQSYDVPMAYGGLVFNQMEALRELIPGHFLGLSLDEAVQWVSENIEKKVPKVNSGELLPIYQETVEQFRERRALIESHVWGIFIATDNSTADIPSIHREFAQLIEAAIGLGDIELLPGDLASMEQLILSYHIPREWLVEYILAYQQATRIHLSGPAQMITEWLAQLVTE